MVFNDVCNKPCANAVLRPLLWLHARQVQGSLGGLETCGSTFMAECPASLARSVSRGRAPVAGQQGQGQEGRQQRARGPAAPGRLRGAPAAGRGRRRRRGRGGRAARGRGRGHLRAAGAVPRAPRRLGAAGGAALQPQPYPAWAPCAAPRLRSPVASVHVLSVLFAFALRSVFSASLQVPCLLSIL